MVSLTGACADSSLGVLTPEGIEFALFPAGPPIRACAYGIDKTIQGILATVLFLTAGILRDAAGMWLILILLFGIDWFYHCVCELFFRGQSPGKRIMGIRVVRDDGSPVNPGASFLRNLLRFADTFLFLCPIAFISMAASRGFRRLGDWAAGTLVVYTPKALALPRRSGGPVQADFTPLVPPTPLSHEEKQAILTFARRYPLLGAARAEEITRPYVRALEAGVPSASAYLLGIARKLAGEGP
ncbi:MAG: RDD family protein [Treponema sp.]|jgi:uncharacterized RDD family membrane protein YckC|nr:RDD family protein [Treponema sp.]